MRGLGQRRRGGRRQLQEAVVGHVVPGGHTDEGDAQDELRHPDEEAGPEGLHQICKEAGFSRGTLLRTYFDQFIQGRDLNSAELEHFLNVFRAF